MSYDKTSQQFSLNDITSPASILTPPIISSFSFGLEENSELDSLLEKLEKYSQHIYASYNSTSLVCVRNKDVGASSQNCESVLLLSNWGLPAKVVEQYEQVESVQCSPGRLSVFYCLTY